MEMIVIEFLFFLGLSLSIGIYKKGATGSNEILKNIGEWGSWIFAALTIIGILILIL